MDVADPFYIAEQPEVIAILGAPAVHRIEQFMLKQRLM
jgi:hypothetical protein